MKWSNSGVAWKMPKGEQGKIQNAEDPTITMSNVIIIMGYGSRSNQVPDVDIFPDRTSHPIKMLHELLLAMSGLESEFLPHSQDENKFLTIPFVHQSELNSMNTLSRLGGYVSELNKLCNERKSVFHITISKHVNQCIESYLDEILSFESQMIQKEYPALSVMKFTLQDVCFSDNLTSSMMYYFHILCNSSKSVIRWMETNYMVLYTWKHQNRLILFTHG
jgi:hypothetical protein